MARLVVARETQLVNSRAYNNCFKRVLSLAHALEPPWVSPRGPVAVGLVPTAATGTLSFWFPETFLMSFELDMSNDEFSSERLVSKPKQSVRL